MSAFLAPRVCWKRSQSSLCSDQCDAATVSVASIARSLLLLRSFLVQSWKSKSPFNKRGLARMASNAQPSGDLSGKLGARASSGNARVSAEVCRKDTALKSVNDKSCTDQETPPVCHPIRPRSCFFREPTSMIPRSSACLDKSTNFGGSETHRAAGS